MVKFQLPMPPSANRLWRHGFNGVFVPDEIKAYKQYAGLLAAQYFTSPLESGVKFSMDVFVPQRRGDLDNYLKVTLDSLNGIAWLDDYQVTEIHLRRFLAPKPKHGKREGYVIVTVEAA